MKRTLKTLAFVIAAIGCVAIAAIWWVLVGYRSAIGNRAKWLLRSHDYKAAVLAQPETTNGELKHVEWDSWGWGGEDTVVYLVFDPTDSLFRAASSHQPGKYNGIPCQVLLVRQLESHWYTVWFYTDHDWRPNC